MSRYSVPLEAGELCGPRQEGTTMFSCGGSNRAKILKYRICVMGAVGRKKLNIHGGIIRLILLTVFFQIFQTITDGFVFKNYWTTRYIISFEHLKD